MLTSNSYFRYAGESRFMEMVIWAGATPRINQHKPCESHVNNEMKFQYY